MQTLIAQFNHADLAIRVREADVPLADCPYILERKVGRKWVEVDAFVDMVYAARRAFELFSAEVR